MQEDIINKNYAEFVQLPSAVKPETHPFTDEEIKTLLNNDDNRICRIILCMIFTGFRPTEFFSIEIKNIDDCDDCVVFHAGTAIKDGKLVTNGGRVLNICATGDSLDEVREKVYKVANKIDFDGKFYRNDIGLR